VKAQTLSSVIAIIIVVLSLILLVRQLSYPQKSTVFLNETVALTDDDPQTQYSVTLNQGDQLQIQVNGNGELVDLTIAPQSSPSQTLVDQSALFPEYSLQWTVPETGVYIFTLVAESGTTATITVTRA
jgi:hypothetical protein